MKSKSSIAKRKNLTKEKKNDGGGWVHNAGKSDDRVGISLHIHKIS